MRLGRREEEFGPLWRLFQRFEECVERLLRQHVHFVDDINLILAVAWGKSDGFIDLPDVVDAAIGRAGDFNDVERLAGGDVEARRTAIAWLFIGKRGRAIERFGKESCESCFSDPARSGKEVGVGDASALES